ncbi:alpha/beta hydrolase [Cucumibacter marinus]|uniref:alpha/beta hydrolase n=1 Tax=Cucumibacter marinus TaxID=1121252 RepID=UPI0004174925|nr:alpha/beta hydrolase [Cucumibacter marinus]
MGELAVSEQAVLADIPSNPMPEGARAAYFTTPDKVRLRYAVWRRSEGPRRGTICLVHGRCEFIEKYYETIEDFRRRGFAVATFDWRGQGGSDRFSTRSKAGYVNRFEDYWTDLKAFHTDILLPDCPPPYFLVGHSMGGLASLLAVARDRLMFDRVFLSSPMIALDFPIGLGIAASILEIAKMAGLGRIEIARRADKPQTEDTFAGNPLTSDFDRYMRMVNTLKERPDLEVRGPTIAWTAAAMRAMSRANAEDFPSRINTPVLMLAAARDQVVSTPATEQLGLRLRTGRHGVIAGARHELFMENDAIRGQVLAAFDAFITEQSPV